jgi:hypothetical protein
MSSGMIAFALLALFAPITMIIAGLLRAQRQDNKDILTHGLPATGTVVGIRNQATRGGQVWTITVEFSVPDHPEPVRFETQIAQSLWFRKPRDIRDLAEGQTVAIHYREKWPSLAVVDQFVS